MTGRLRKLSPLASVLLVGLAIFVLIVVILVITGSAQVRETPVMKIESFYEIVTTWYPPLTEPRVDSTYLFTDTTFYK